jgi:hypothetical protein
VAYVTRDRDETGAGRLRTTVFRVDLPRAAEGRLKSTLARVAAAAAT